MYKPAQVVLYLFLREFFARSEKMHLLLSTHPLPRAKAFLCGFFAAALQGEIMKPVLGIIAGSVRLDAIFDIATRSTDPVPTPFGTTSSGLKIGMINGQAVVFLSRHGPGHTIPAHAINYRANIFALKEQGVTHLVAFTAVGSMREEILPGHAVIPDQLVDHTTGRKSTFFDNEIAAHVSFAEPFCQPWCEHILDAVRNVYGYSQTHGGGTYFCMNGPQFSTRAESLAYRKIYDNLTVIGMTAAQEAKLAREAEICFAVVALPTDFCAWNTKAPHTTAAEVTRMAAAHSEQVERIIRKIAGIMNDLPLEQQCRCGCALDGAIMTAFTQQVWPETLNNYDVLLARYRGQNT